MILYTFFLQDFRRCEVFLNDFYFLCYAYILQCLFEREVQEFLKGIFILFDPLNLDFDTLKRFSYAFFLKSWRRFRMKKYLFRVLFCCQNKLSFSQEVYLIICLSVNMRTCNIEGKSVTKKMSYKLNLFLEPLLLVCHVQVPNLDFFSKFILIYDLKQYSHHFRWINLLPFLVAFNQFIGLLKLWGTLLIIGAQFQTAYWYIQLVDGKIFTKVFNGSMDIQLEYTPTESVCDGQWHELRVRK